MLTVAGVRAAVDAAEVRYRECWSLLDAAKEPAATRTRDLSSILRFQPQLALAISDLSKVYRDAALERRGLVDRKHALNTKWFVRRMRFLDSQQRVIEEAVQVGKAIGDAFAWIFYRNDRPLLHEHLKEQEQLLLPAGVGGFAELAMVQQVHSFKGRFVLYHGITSILRLGDVSLIDLQSKRVVTVGEIKAGAPRGDQLDVSLVFPMSSNEQARQLGFDRPAINAMSSAVGKKPALEGLSPAAKARMERQMARMSKSLSSTTSKADRRLTYDMEGRVKKFGQFLRGIGKGRSAQQMLSPSLLVLGVRSSNRSLYARLTSRRTPNLGKMFQGLDKLAAGLAIPGCGHNAVGISTWHYREDGKLDHRPGMTHSMWWPLPAEVLRGVVFKELVVVTILNPAHLLVRLESAGYVVTPTEKTSWAAEKKCGDHTMSLKGIGHYLDLIQHYLFSEEDIAGFLELVEREVPPTRSGANLEIRLDIQQHFGSRPH